MTSPADAAVLLDDGTGTTVLGVDDLWDPATGRYRVPVVDLPAGLGGPDVGRGQVTTIVDSGVAFAHPWVERSLAKAWDLTGEGPEDRLGHGTAVALVLLAWAPAATLLSVKAFDQTGRTTRERLIAAIRLATRSGCTVLNLSCGIYTPGCRGDCDVCRATLDGAEENGVVVAAAAGNTRGTTACPAKAGALASSRVMAVGSHDPTGARADGSGDVPAGTLAPGTVEFHLREPEVGR